MPHEGFRSTLLEIDGELGTTDVQRLKFLTKDHLPHGGLTKSSRGIDVFSTLEQKGRLRENDTRFLQECFHYMQRRDLVRRLGGDPEGLEDLIEREGPNRIFPFRILLYNIAEDIGQTDLDTLKFYARNQYELSKKQMDGITTCLDLFNVLEREGILQPPEVRELENLVNSVGDEELRELIDNYKKDNGLICQPKTSEAFISPVPHGNPAYHHGYTTVPNTTQAGPSGRNFGNQGRQLHQQTGYTGGLPTMQSMQEQDASDTIMSMRNNDLQIQDLEDGACAANQNMDLVNEALDSINAEYKMTAIPRGYCIVINIQNFTNEAIPTSMEPLKPRKGSDVDADAVCRVFKDKLKFIVERHNDLTGRGILQLCRKVAERNHKKYDVFAMCILSHGNLGNVYGTDGMTLSIRDITNCFTARSCPSLVDKPKLFFLQACQGTEKQKGISQLVQRQVSSMETDVAPDKRPQNSSIPDDADFLFGYATVPGYASFRSRSRGSFYIMTLVEALEQYASREDLLSILVHVNNKVCDKDAPMQGEIYKQVPAPQYTLRKKVYFRDA